MSSDYDALLEATIGQLHFLKKTGVQFLQVDAQTLQSLALPAPQRVVRKSPAPAQLETEQKIAAATSIPLMQQGMKHCDCEKEEAMAALRHQVLQCEKCRHLVSARKNVVFGVGSVHTELMFVGEAPGADEDEMGEPFVGKAGQLLTRIINAMGYTRETIYIANILKCRPDMPGQMSGNRKPTTDEMKTCLPYLLRQIEIIQPKVIVALGATAMEGLFGKANGIMKLRGNWQSFQNIPVMPTYHPAYLLRNQLITEKRKVWEDMLQVLEKLNCPITEKQRNYFLKAS